ncbi:MAG: M28 family peptidase [Flavobacteriales bacterium]
MRRSITLLGIALASHCSAQDRAVVNARARAFLDTLTSSAFHGRGYVANGEVIASDWIAKQFKRIGLEPVKSDFFEPFTFNVNTFPDSVRVNIDGRQLVPGVDFLVDPASGKADGKFDLIHLTPADLGSPERSSMTMGVITGKATCLHFPASKNADSLRLFADWEQDLMHYGPVVKPAHGKLTWSVAQEAMPYPMIEVAGDALTDSSTTVELHVKNKLLVRHDARNVLGMVKGHSKKWLVIGAHYDHLGQMGPDALFPGANDNASGTAMLLSLAEWFSQHPIKYNILFVAFAGEEAGLVGSQWCAVDRPIDWGMVRLMINLDILGTGDEGITVVNATAQKAEFDQLVAINGAKNYMPQIKARGPACISDHCPFVERGVPGIYIYTMGGIKAYHDVFDKGETLPLTKFGDLYALLTDFITGLK